MILLYWCQFTVGVGVASACTYVGRPIDGGNVFVYDPGAWELG